jgi:hypothetical protein
VVADAGVAAVEGLWWLVEEGEGLGSGGGGGLRGWVRGISHPIWYKAHKLAPKWSSKYSLVYIRYHIFRDS